MSAHRYISISTDLQLQVITQLNHSITSGVASTRLNVKNRPLLAVRVALVDGDERDLFEGKPEPGLSSTQRTCK